MRRRCDPVFYNEIDPYAAQWLRNLVAAGHLPAGHVDKRSILDLDPDDLGPFRQCHFFAGIGGWPYALNLAGWPDDREVWTGSCPCQPLSSAGQRRGHADERHLWPAFYRLIAECRPATVFGEQVASKDGCEWLAGIRADLEHLGYAVGAADLSVAGVGAPHIRQRLFWVGDADPAGPQGRREHAGEYASQRSAWASGEFLSCLDGRARRVKPGIFPLAHGVSARVGRLRAYGNAVVPQVAAAFVRAYGELT
jgi:DNA (cytosine-5)-methyltransferase 1